MHIITIRHLNEAAARYADAAAEIAAWHTIVKQARWTNFVELRETFADADAVDGCVIFNVRRNRYRLVTAVHYAGEYQGNPTMGRVYIRSFLTRKEYDNPRKWEREYSR